MYRSGIFLSAVCAAAAVMGAAAGLSVTADAAEITKEIYFNSFDALAWSNTNSAGTESELTRFDAASMPVHDGSPSGQVYRVHAVGTGDRFNYAVFTSANTEARSDGSAVTEVKLDFDWYCATGSNVGHFTAVGGSGADFKEKKDIAFAIGAGDTGGVEFGRDFVSIYDTDKSEWVLTDLPSNIFYHVSADIDFEKGSVSYTIGDENFGPFGTEVTDLSKMINGGLRDYKGTVALENYIDNFRLSYVDIVDDYGYTIKTTPYAIIAVDGVQTGISDRLGNYTFDISKTGAAKLTISKNGYQTRTEDIVLSKNTQADYPLTPNAGLYYYEDFDNVYDTFGFTAASGSVDGTKVEDGVLVPTIISPEAIDDYYGRAYQTIGRTTANFAEPIYLEGRTITIDADFTSRTPDDYGLFCLEGIGISYGVRPGIGLRYIHGSWGTSFFSTPEDTDHYINRRMTYQIKVDPNDVPEAKKARAYINGEFFSYLECSEVAVTGISEVFDKGSNIYSHIYSIAVEDSADDVKLTFGYDGAEHEKEYLKGTEITLPYPPANKGWTDGTAYYEAGTKLIADKDMTLTAADYAGGETAYSASINRVTASIDGGDTVFTAEFTLPSEESCNGLKWHVSANSSIYDKEPSIPQLTGNGRFAVALVIKNVTDSNGTAKLTFLN